MKPHLYIFSVLLLLLFFVTETVAQDKKTEVDTKKEPSISLKDNPYKGSRYQEVYNAVLHLKNGEYAEAQVIIDKIQQSKKRLVTQKRDNTKDFSVYNSLYYLTLSALSLQASDSAVIDTPTVKGYIAKATEARQQIKSTYDVKHLQTLGFDELVTKYTPKPPAPPPPPPARELTEEEKIELKLNEIAEKVQVDIGTLYDTIRGSAGRDTLDRENDGIVVGNCAEDIDRLDLQIAFDYMEEGFSGAADLKSLEVTNEQLNNVIHALSNIVEDFVVKQDLSSDDVSVSITAQTDSSKFKQNFLVDRMPIKGKMYDEEEVVYINTDGQKKRLRYEGLILTHKELAASRVELAKQKILNSHEMMKDIKIDTDYLVGTENKVFIKLILKNAFTIYLDDLKEDVQAALFSKILDKKCVCAVRCANCDEYEYCKQCPDCQTDEVKK